MGKLGIDNLGKATFLFKSHLGSHGKLVSKVFNRDNAHQIGNKIGHVITAGERGVSREEAPYVFIVTGKAPEGATEPQHFHRGGHRGAIPSRAHRPSMYVPSDSFVKEADKLIRERLVAQEGSCMVLVREICDVLIESKKLPTRH